MSLADKIIAKHGGQVEGQQTGLTGIADRIIAKNGGPETSNFTKSIANAGGSTLAGVGRGLKDIGVDGLGNAAIEKGRQIQADNQPSIQSFGDIAEHPIEYAKESIGQMAGQAGMALAGGGLGTAIGYGLGSLTGPLAPVAAPALGALGGYIGGNAPMLAQEYGSSREEQLQKGIDDKGRALTGALVNTGIENLGGFKPGGMAGIGKKAISELAGKSFSEGAKILGKKALVSGLEEASEEIPQQYVGAYGGGQDAPDLFNAENAKQAGLGAAMALPGGMLFGAGNTVAKHYRSDLGQENPLAGQWQQPGYEYRGEGIAGPQNQPLGLPAPAKGIGAPPQRGNIAPDTQIVFDDGSTTSAYDYFDQRMAAHGDEDRARQETFQALVGSPKPVTQPRLTDSGIIFSGYDGEQTVTPTGQPVPDEVKKAADAGGVMSNALLAGSQNLGFDFMGNAKTRPYKQRPGLAEAQAEREAIQNEGNLPPEDFSNNIPYDSGKGITWDDYEDNPLAGQWQSPQYKGKSRAQSIIDQQTKRPDLGLQGFIDSRNPQANLTENDLRQVGAWQQPQYDDKKAQKTGSTQTPEQNAQPLGGLQSQESSFQPTHTLNGTTPVVATDDPLVWFDGQNEIEISKDDVAEPINAIPTTRSNATPDTGAAGANRATGAADSGTGSGLSGGNGQSASGGTTGNARGLPGATQQPSDSQSGRALDPILTLSKGDYLQSQYKQFKADHPDASQLAANAYTNNIRDNYDALLEEAKANDQQPGAEGLGENASERQSKDSKKTDLQENQIPPTWENPTDEDDGRWHGTRIEKKPEFKKEQPTQGTVHRVYKGSSTGVIEFQPDGTDSIFRLRPDQIGRVLSISDSKQSANAASEITGENTKKSTDDIRPPVGKHNNNAKDGSVEEQLRIARNSGRIANLQALNNVVGAYTTDELNSIAPENIDAVGEYLLKKYNESKQTNQTQPVPPNAGANPGGNVETVGAGAESAGVQSEEAIAPIKQPLNTQATPDAAPAGISESQLNKNQAKPKHRITEKQAYPFERGLQEGAANHALSMGLDAQTTANKSGVFKDAERNAFIKGFNLANTGEYYDQWKAGSNLTKHAEERGQVEVKRKEPERVGNFIPKVPAVHIEGQFKAKATTEKISNALKKAAERKSWSKSKMRDWLVTEIDKAIETANESGYASLERTDELDKLEEEAKQIIDTTGRQGADEKYGELHMQNLRSRLTQIDSKIQDIKAKQVAESVGQVTFDVPGDGRFKVMNTKQSLRNFKEKVLASPGFKDTKRSTTSKPKAPSFSVSTMIADFLKDGEYDNAYYAAQEAGVRLGFGHGGNNSILTYTDLESVDLIPNRPMFVGRHFSQRTANWAVIDFVGRHFSQRTANWAVIDEKSGFAFATGNSKKEVLDRAKEVLAAKKDRLDQLLQDAEQRGETQEQLLEKFKKLHGITDEQQEKPPTPDNKAEGLQGSKATRSQAAVGGEIGVNGYFYKGGQFLPSTDAEPGRWKIGKKWITSGKEQIEPSKWSNQPTPFSRAIFPMIQGWVIRDGDKLNFRDGVRQYNGEPVTLDMEIRPGVKGVMGKEALTIGEMIDAYNNGQRWFDVKPNAETVTTEQKTESHVTDNATQNETATPKLPGEDIFANAIKLAADSVEKLRKQDVYRVIDDLAAEGLQETVSSGAQNDNQAPQSESDKQALAKVAYDEMYGLPPYKSSTPSGQRQYEVNLAKYMADKFGMSSQEAKRRIKSAIDKDTRGTSSAVIPMLQSHIRTIVNGLYNDGFFNIAKPNITDNAAQNETATHGNVKQNEANGKENQSTDLSLIFAKLPKSGKLSAKLKAEVDAHPKADIIRTVQAHWADVLADHGYVTDKAGNPMDVSGNPLGKAKSILISNLKCAK